MSLGISCPQHPQPILFLMTHTFDTPYIPQCNDNNQHLLANSIYVELSVTSLQVLTCEHQNVLHVFPPSTAMLHLVYAFKQHPIETSPVYLISYYSVLQGFCFNLNLALLEGFCKYSIISCYHGSTIMISIMQYSLMVDFIVSSFNLLYPESCCAS